MNWIFIYIFWFLLVSIISLNKMLGALSDNYLIATAIMYASFIYIIIEERKDKNNRLTKGR